MQRRKPQLITTWEHIADPTADERLRRALKLLLDDAREISPTLDFDTDSLSRLNEGVLVENTNSSETHA